MAAQRICITGLGAVTPYGQGAERLWAALLEGRDAIADLALFETSDCLFRRGGEVPAPVADALRALECCAFDLVVVGVEAQRPTQLAILPHLRVQAPELPVLVVGRDLPEPTVERARRYQAHEVIELPARAADLRDLVAHLALHYLAVAPAV